MSNVMLVTQIPVDVGSQSSSLLMWGMVFGAIGMGYFVYGKRQGRAIPLVAGIVLSVLPFFLVDTVPLVLVGLLVAIAPYFLRAR